MIKKRVLFLGIVFSLILLVLLFDQFQAQSIFAQSVPTNKSKSNEQQFATLILNTVPETSNVTVIIDKKTYKSDNNGNILFIGKAGEHKIEVPHKLTDENISKNSKNPTFYTFDRWKPFMPKNFTLSLAAGTHIQMDLGIVRMSEINLFFLDSNFHSINKSNIQKVVLLSNTGKIFELYYPFTTFLDNNYINLKYPHIEERVNTGNLTVLSSPELEVNEMNYTISEVLMNGINVIDKSRQQSLLTPSLNASFIVYCRVFPLEIELQDKLFGYSVNEKFNIRLSNLETDLKENSADSPLFFTKSNDTLLIPQLAQGIYAIKVENGSGIAGTSSVVVNKPQEVVIDIITYQSLAIVSIIAVPILILIIQIIKRLNKFILKIERE